MGLVRKPKFLIRLVGTPKNVEKYGKFGNSSFQPNSPQKMAEGPLSVGFREDRSPNIKDCEKVPNVSGI